MTFSTNKLWIFLLFLWYGYIGLVCSSYFDDNEEHPLGTLKEGRKAFKGVHLKDKTILELCMSNLGKTFETSKLKKLELELRIKEGQKITRASCREKTQHSLRRWKCGGKTSRMSYADFEIKNRKIFDVLDYFLLLQNKASLQGIDSHVVPIKDLRMRLSFYKTLRSPGVQLRIEYSYRLDKPKYRKNHVWEESRFRRILEEKFHNNVADYMYWAAMIMNRMIMAEVFKREKAKLYRLAVEKIQTQKIVFTDETYDPQTACFLSIFTFQKEYIIDQNSVQAWQSYETLNKNSGGRSFRQISKLLELFCIIFYPFNSETRPDINDLSVSLARYERIYSHIKTLNQTYSEEINRLLGYIKILCTKFKKYIPSCH